MTGWVFVIVGVVFIGLGTISTGYGWFTMRREQTAHMSEVSKKPEEAELKQKQSAVQINRLIEDLLTYLRLAVEQHQKAIDEIAQQYAYRNTYSSGMHLAQQYRLALQHRREISNKWTDFKRKVEDVLFDAGQPDLSAEQKQAYENAEKSVQETRETLLNLTHTYFASRTATFSVADLEKLKQSVLDETLSP